MQPYRIYNKSSAQMSEAPDSSVDVVVTSPPYNIGTRYGDNTDKLSLAEYQTLLEQVFAECVRILKDDGVLIVECADSILTDGVYIQLVGYVQSLCVRAGLQVATRHINFAHSEHGVELTENEKWNSAYQTTADNHSNCHQIVVLSKDPATVFNPDGKILYFDYIAEMGHPCPTPRGVYDLIVQTYVRRGVVVADPFMGTGILGVEVLRQGGTFVGYELDTKIFDIAQKNLTEGPTSGS